MKKVAKIMKITTMNKAPKQKFTRQEKDILFELVFNEQNDLIVNDKYNTRKYLLLEELKMKIKNM